MNSYQLGVGWVKQSKKDGSQFLSMVGGDKRNNIKLYAEVNGERVEISNFLIFFNQDKEEGSKMPDVRMTMFVE
jgi:uncharacterized protein (DUF736 family)